MTTPATQSPSVHTSALHSGHPSGHPSAQAQGARLVDWLVRLMVALITVVVLPLATWIASREIARSDALQLRVAELERRDAVREVMMDGFRVDLEKGPTLEQIRVVIREEIDRARLPHQ